MSTVPNTPRSCLYPATPICLVDAENYCRTHEGIHPTAEVVSGIPDIDFSCPDWCTYDHRTDDVRDDLVLHQGDDETDGTVRQLLDGVLDIRVSRTDCPSEGRRGEPSLRIHCELELTTWEQAAELARTILDGFGYLNGADRD